VHTGTETAAASTPSSEDQSTPQAASPDQSNTATNLFVPGAAAEQLNVLTQWRAGSLASSQAGELTVGSVATAKSPEAAINSKGASKDATGVAAGGSAISNQNTQATALQSGSQTGSQDAASSGNQGQGTAAPQGQDTVAAQANFAGHAAAAAVAHTVSAATDTTSQSASTPARADGHAAMGTENAAQASVPATASQPVVNTAKLIQNVGQSEMHVGMRSNEFGNISISTSAVKDGVSAQISVDHSELAKSLAAHLPEMQARLGSNQQMDVRIDVNGQRAGQGTASNTGGSNNSSDDARGYRRQTANTTSSQSGNGYSTGTFQPVAAAASTGDGRYNSRLDIRI